MTIITLTFNIPAGADTSDTLAALTGYFAGSVPASPSVADLTAALTQRNANWIKELVKDYRKTQANVVAPTIT